VVSVELDQLAQEGDRKEELALVFLFEDDLRQNRPRDVLAGLGIGHDEILAGPHHLREIFQRYIRARARVIEATIGVFLDDRRGFGALFGHELHHSLFWRATNAGRHSVIATPPSTIVVIRFSVLTMVACPVS